MGDWHGHQRQVPRSHPTGAQEFDRILSETRKYKLVLIVANQFVSQLQEKVRDAIFGNVGCLVIFRIGPRDSGSLKDEFDGIRKQELMNLTRGQCYVRFSTPFNTYSVPVRTPAPPKCNDDPTTEIVNRMHKLIADLRGDEDKADHAATTCDMHPERQEDNPKEEKLVLCEFA